MHFMYLRLSHILGFFALLLFWVAACLWLVLAALQSRDEALERSVRTGTEALAAAGATSQDWVGLLLDRSGRLLMAQPADLLDGVDDAQAYAALLWAAAGGVNQGWLDIDGAPERFRRAYFSRAAQGRAWVGLAPCRRLDLRCAHAPIGVATAVLALLAPLGLLMAWLARAVGGGPLPPPAWQAGDAERMQAVGHLTAVFAHELNNQLGIISNSASLVRHVGDARLALPAQAMLKAVQAASALTHRLQRYAERGPARPRAMDLRSWLPRLQPALALLLGKRMALDMGVAPQAMPVQVDPEAFELALSCVMLGVREGLSGGTLVRLTAALVDEAAADRSTAGRQVQVCVEAWEAWPPGQAQSCAAAPATEGDGLEPLALAEDLCRGMGGEVCSCSEPGRWVVLALVLPVRDGGVAPGSSA